MGLSLEHMIYFSWVFVGKLLPRRGPTLQVSSRDAGPDICLMMLLAAMISAAPAAQ